MVHTRNGSFKLNGMGNDSMGFDLNFDAMLAQAQAGLLSSAAGQVAASPEFKALAAQSAATTAGSKFYTFLTTYKKPLMYAGIAIALVGVVTIAKSAMKRS